MIRIEVSAKRIRTVGLQGYITYNWMSPRQEDGFKRLLTMMVFNDR